MALLAVHARVLGLLSRAETWLVLLVVVLGSVVGTLIKPEMLSLDFAIAVGDYRTAWRLLDQLEGRLRPQVDPGDSSVWQTIETRTGPWRPARSTGPDDPRAGTI